MNQGPYEITGLDQLEALTSPVRGEIIDIVALSGPLAVAEIAETLGRAADSLYYHIRTLKKVGLLVRAGERKAFRQTEAIYDVPGRPMIFRYDPADAGAADIMVRGVAGMTRLAERQFRAAFQHGLVREIDGEPNVVHGRTVGWYTDDEIMQLRARILSVVRSFEAESSPDGGDRRLYALTSLLVPLEADGSSHSPDQSLEGDRREDSRDSLRDVGGGKRDVR